MYVLLISMLINSFCYPVVGFIHVSWVGHGHTVFLGGGNPPSIFMLAHVISIYSCSSAWFV